MNARLTPKDWELLSAYLDSALSAAEERQMARLLAQRPELGQGLAELRRTRAVLRAAPRRRAPRNFTLTPAMVQVSAKAKEPRRAFNWGWGPSFGVASALATLLLVLSVFFQSAISFAPAAAPAPMAARQSAPAGETQPPVILWGESGGVKGLGGYGGPADSAAPPPPAATAAPAAAVAPTGKASIAGGTAPTGTPAPSLVPKAALPPSTQAAAAGAQKESSQGPILGVAPTEERGRMLVSPQEPVHAVESPTPGFSVQWVWVQAGLGAAALGFALAAFFVWRRSRH